MLSVSVYAWRVTDKKTTRTSLQLCLDAYQLAPILQNFRRITDHVVHNSPRRQNVLDQRSNVTHQERDRLDRLLRVLLHLMLIRNDALRSELPNLRLAIPLPVLDVRRPAHAQRAPRVDQRAHDVAVVRAEEGRLVRSRCARLLRRDEARAHPDGLRAVDEVRGQPAPIVDCARADNPYWLAGEWGGAALDCVDDGGNEDGRGDVTRVAAAFACLRADEVDADVECLFDVLGMADHLREKIAMFGKRVIE
jgi:hypothetical protein